MRRINTNLTKLENTFILLLNSIKHNDNKEEKNI